VHQQIISLKKKMFKLILCLITFYTVTSFNIDQLSKQTSNLSPNQYQHQQQHHTLLQFKQFNNNFDSDLDSDPDPVTDSNADRNQNIQTNKNSDSQENITPFSYKGESVTLPSKKILTRDQINQFIKEKMEVLKTEQVYYHWTRPVRGKHKITKFL
jgi:hypothetical protein